MHNRSGDNIGRTGIGIHVANADPTPRRSPNQWVSNTAFAVFCYGAGIISGILAAHWLS